MGIRPARAPAREGLPALGGLRAFFVFLCARAEDSSPAGLFEKGCRHENEYLDAGFRSVSVIVCGGAADPD